ncbi:MAG: histidine kinase, partial [Gemmatimonadetes bacterium]|nr:histidine kinase [Gemmatimonadota bacterium]
LQPLVENAIVHGFGRITGRGVLEISARRDGASLVLRVRDNGPGPGATATAPGLGIGLGNLRSRLARLHGDAADVAVVPAPGGGCDATITLPWEVATEVAVRVPQPVGVLP